MSLVLPAAVSYAGYELTELVDGTPRILTQVVRGLDQPRGVRGADTVIPGATGRIRRIRVSDTLVIELLVTVMAVGSSEAEQRADLREVIDELVALFDPVNGDAELVASLEDDSLRSIMAAPVNVLPSTDLSIPTRRVLSVELEAVGEVGWAEPGS